MTYTYRRNDAVGSVVAPDRGYVRRRVKVPCSSCGSPIRPPSKLCVACSKEARANRALASFGDRFWSHVDKGDGCWTWTAARDRKGYGFVSAPVGGGTLHAHRVAWELERGPIPAGLFVCHHCDNPPCVRPDHLFLGTPSENLLDMHRKGRWVRARGSLTPDQVAEIRIRYAAGESGASLGRAFGVGPDQARRVAKGECFKHLPMPTGGSR